MVGVDKLIYRFFEIITREFYNRVLFYYGLKIIKVLEYSIKLKIIFLNMIISNDVSKFLLH